MNPITSQQAALDNSLVALKKRLKIERCNARIAFTKPQKEETYQVTLESLKLSPCYLAFQITAKVPEIYMHQFWNTIKKIGKTDAYDFKLDKKKCRVDTKVFCEILHICPRLPNQDFVELPSEDDLLSFIKELGYSGNCEMLSAIRTDQMHQPWRTFAAVINRCISAKSTGLDRLRESRAQVLLAMYNQKNVNYVALLWEDFMYQDDNREISSTRKEHMPYPRFTKSVRCSEVFSITEDCQKYGALIPDGMINDDIKQSQAYKIYLDYAIGKAPPKKARKFKKPIYPKLKTVPTSPKEPTQKGKRSVSKKKAPAKTDRGKGIELLSDAVLLEEAQLEKTLRKSKRETHKLQASGSSEGADFESDVPDEQTGKTKDTSEGTGMKPGDPDVSKEYSSDSDDDSWGNNEDENYDFNDEDDDGGNDNDNGNDDDSGNDAQDSHQTDSDDDENPSFTLNDYEEEEQDEEYVHTPEKDKSDDEEKMYEEEDDDVAKDLYGDLNITQGLKDTDMTNAEQSTMQSSSVSSYFTSKLLNLDNTSPDINEISSLMNTSIIPPLPPPVNPSLHLTIIPQQQTPDSTTTKTNPIMTLPEIPNFYLASKTKEAVDVAVRLQLNKLKEETKAENQEFFNQVDSTMKAIIKDQVKAQVSQDTISCHRLKST
ncbi:hypothetical protein Tco_1191016 [Tanacetum coccineum]